MTRHFRIAFAMLLTVTAGSAIGQTTGSSGGNPPAASNTTGMSGDTSKNAGQALRAPDTAGAVDVSPGVGTIEGADGKPPIPSGANR